MSYGWKAGKLLKEYISKLIDNKLDDDINRGQELLNRCKTYDNLSKLHGIRYCSNVHVKEVKLYIQNIINNYGNLISLFNLINSNSKGGKSSIDCKSLDLYVSFLNKVKDAKKILMI